MKENLIGGFFTQLQGHVGDVRKLIVGIMDIHHETHCSVNYLKRPYIRSHPYLMRSIIIC